MHSCWARARRSWWSAVLLLITLGLASEALLTWIAGLPAIAPLRAFLGNRQVAGR